MNPTIEDVKDGLAAAGKPASESTVRRYFTAVGIKPVGARQLPQRYPPDTVARLLEYLGIVLNGDTGIVSVPEAKRRAASKRRAKR